MAEEAEVDLVEISPNAQPPVCRLIDYGKFKYAQDKKDAESRQRQRQNQIQLKEVKFRPSTDIGDYQIKLRNTL
jgi:translation initiation factor IF-3